MKKLLLSTRNVLQTIKWRPYSRLFILGDKQRWSIQEDAKALNSIASGIGITIEDTKYIPFCKNQSLFLCDRYQIFNLINKVKEFRLGFSYFHGRPGTGSEFDKFFVFIQERHEEIDRIHVSHSEIRNQVLNTGINPNKVFQIPIGINLAGFTYQTSETRKKMREKMNIPDTAFVVGSFQKDGQKWGDGLEPKLIKGPDIFLNVVTELHHKIPELWVMLTGPARGYVKAGLEKAGIPYRHVFLNNYHDIGQYYQVLDVYVITSRQEGGPKAVLESMASGIPLVTTRVGQAMDIVSHGENGYMVDVEDVQGLVSWVEHVNENRNNLEPIRLEAYRTAEKNTYQSQIPLWKKLFEGFVNF